MNDYETWIGKTVQKCSGKPFKSGLKTATVKAIAIHPIFPELPAFSTEEDESIVEFRQCHLSQWKPKHPTGPGYYPATPNDEDTWLDGIPEIVYVSFDGKFHVVRPGYEKRFTFEDFYAWGDRIEIEKTGKWPRVSNVE